MMFVYFSVDAVVARYKHEHIVEGLSLIEPVSRVSEYFFDYYCSVLTENQNTNVPGSDFVLYFGRLGAL